MAAGESLSNSQFLNRNPHLQTKEQFESRPDVMFHGTLSGKIGVHGEPIHVGTRSAAEELVVQRANSSLYYDDRDADADDIEGLNKTLGKRGGLKQKSGYGAASSSPRAKHGSDQNYEAHFPAVIAGTINKHRMMNEPGSSYDDGQAQDLESTLTKRNQGVYYENDHEDPGSLSAILPNRSHFTTHEDHILQARQMGKSIPKKVLKGYPHLGQDRLF